MRRSTSPPPLPISSPGVRACRRSCCRNCGCRAPSSAPRWASASASPVVVAFYFGLSASFALALPLGGLIGAGIATAFLLMLARRGVATATLILAGVALNSLTGALTALALNLAPSPYAALEVVFWLMGSLSDRSLVHVALALPFMMVGWGLVLATGPALDAL
ncbi:MAG: hypothetical protein B7Z41_07795 [Rhizobiales bacterium 12-66-7]|nr:MAG: hypothetical protein B7Z41_07795 [Rhizobiales bacterium 12-66-7]